MSKTLRIIVLLTVSGLAGCNQTDHGTAEQPAGIDRPCTAAAFPELYVAATASMDADQWANAQCALERIESVEEGLAQQMRFIELRARRSKRVGYKVALGSEALYKGFGLSHPVVGVLFEDMLLKSGARVSRSAGFRLGYEADLMVRVADAAINDAKTLEEVASSLESVIAFIELPDLIVRPDPKAGGQFLAINASARLGVLGESIAVSPDPGFIASLETMRVVTTDASGVVLSEAQGNAVMGNPLNAVLVLVEQLQDRGETLVPGDLVSLGTYSPPAPVADSAEVNVAYAGIGGATITVSVEFE